MHGSGDRGEGILVRGYCMGEGMIQGIDEGIVGGVRGYV